MIPEELVEYVHGGGSGRRSGESESGGSCLINIVSTDQHDLCVMRDGDG